MRADRLMKLAGIIRKMGNGAADTFGPDRPSITAAAATEHHPLPDLFGMNVWWAPERDNPIQRVMGIAGCAVKNWAADARAALRPGGRAEIDLVDGAGAVLGIDRETAWELVSGRGATPAGMTGSVAAVQITREDAATACERVAEGVTGTDIWSHAHARLAAQVRHGG